MPIKLMYITNDEQVAAIADETGVDRVFIDLEKLSLAAQENLRVNYLMMEQ